MGFIIPFYIFFGTNLLTESPVQIAVFFAYFSVPQKRNIKRSPNGMKPSRGSFLNKHNPGNLEWMLRKQRGGQEVGWRAQGVGATHPRGPLMAPPTYLLRLYILLYPENIQEHHETLFPLPQPSVPVRSHLGAFSGDLSEGDSITEGFYINTMASPMMRE